MQAVLGADVQKVKAPCGQHPVYQRKPAAVLEHDVEHQRVRVIEGGLQLAEPRAEQSGIDRPWPLVDATAAELDISTSWIVSRRARFRYTYSCTAG